MAVVVEPSKPSLHHARRKEEKKGRDFFWPILGGDFVLLLGPPKNLVHSWPSNFSPKVCLFYFSSLGLPKQLARRWQSNSVFPFTWVSHFLVESWQSIFVASIPLGLPLLGLSKQDSPGHAIFVSSPCALVKLRPSAYSRGNYVCGFLQVLLLFFAFIVLWADSSCL